MPRPQPVVNEIPFSEAERARLTALCRRWTGNSPIADDLAQETFLIALRKREQNQSPREWQPYLTGIARRLCQNYLRRQQQEETYREQGAIVTEATKSDPAETDPLLPLLQREREALVDHALSHLKGSMRELLVARYIQEQTLSEIAARQGLTENAATVRLHRSREALERVLTTRLREEASALGLLPEAAADGWRQTVLFCPRCGTSRLQGRFIAQEDRSDFALYCPTCSGQLIGMTSEVQPMDSQALLHGVSGFRAGLNRINLWWQRYLTNALEQRTAACPVCGQTADVRLISSPNGTGLSLVCNTCQQSTFYITPTGLTYHSEVLQRFWRRYPRLRNRSERHTICENRPAILTTFADVTGAARVDILYDKETLQTLRVDTIG